MCGSYIFYGFNLEKWPFFRVDMAGLGIYHMGGYGRIGVYRDNIMLKSNQPASNPPNKRKPANICQLVANDWHSWHRIIRKPKLKKTGRRPKVSVNWPLMPAPKRIPSMAIVVQNVET